MIRDNEDPYIGLRPELPQYVSLGAGVQSSVMVLMAAAGEIRPMPKAAIFADTGAEPQSVYTWLDWLEAQLPFPVYRVAQGDLGMDNLVVRRSKKSGKVYRRSLIPTFGWNDRLKEPAGIFPRKCTRDYKITPILRKVKELAHVPRRRTGIHAVQWIGISTDEIIRMKESREPWTVNRWPLIERGMSRADCLAWMQARGLPQPPRSACVFCPYHSDREWVRLRDEEPAEFARAVQYERDQIAAAAKDEVATATPYLHADRIPLDQVIFRPQEAKADAFGNECEGMCGV